MLYVNTIHMYVACKNIDQRNKKWLHVFLHVLNTRKDKLFLNIVIHVAYTIYYLETIEPKKHRTNKSKQIRWLERLLI